MFRTCIVDTNTNKVVNLIEYETEQTGIPDGMSSNYLCVPSDTGEIGGEYVNGKIVNPIPNPPTAEQNKQAASSLLLRTDWTTIADVSDPTKSNPYLSNSDEFIAYRNKIRKIAVNPVAGELSWPLMPKCIWKTI